MSDHHGVKTATQHLSDGSGDNGVPSSQSTQSKTSHPVLGPGIAIYDNRSKTRLRLVMWIAMVPLGIFGIWLGRGDIASGRSVSGVAQALGGVFLVAYSFQAAWLDARRLVNPIRLVIARNGFAVVPGNRTISWDEVESISDPRSPEGQPKMLRIQLSDPDGFEQRHGLSPFARLTFKFHRGDLLLGNGLAMPVLKAESLMRRHLADFHPLASDNTSAPVSTRQPKARRSRPKG